MLIPKIGLWAMQFHSIREHRMCSTWEEDSRVFVSLMCGAPFGKPRHRKRLINLLRKIGKSEGQLIEKGPDLSGPSALLLSHATR